MGRKILFIAFLNSFLISMLFALDGNQITPKNVAARYQDVRIKEFPFAVQCWTFRKFTFFETLEKVEQLGIKYIQAYGRQRLSKDLPENVTFGPDLTDQQIKLVKQKLKQHGIKVVAMGVVRFKNEEQDMRRYFDFAKKMGIRLIITEPAYDDYSLIEKMVKEYNIRVAIHNHPIPSKYARPETVLFRIKDLDPRIGVCADTGHWLRSGVVPVEALRVLEGRILDVHLKDLNELGKKEAYDVPFGQGVASIYEILAELTLQNYKGFLTIEHEKKEDALNPIPPVKEGMEYVKKITYYQGYEELLKLDRGRGRYSKHGWNHYGPGYFELDEDTGILKSFGGMGLFWYSARKFKDFVLELDYRCSQHDTNSGIFLRVPEMPINNDYIYHSFEIQIGDHFKGTHMTGAVYDAEPPKQDLIKKAIKPTGEWNHYKITFKGDRIIVELNGIEVVNWKAEPRGKVKDFAREGYIGLQNHDSRSPVYFKNIFIKEL